MLLLDISVRFPSLTLTAVLIILLCRDARQYQDAWIGIAVLTASIASSLHTMPAALGLPYPIFAIALFVSVPAAALQWWFARSILQDDFKPGPIDWAIMAAACAFKLGWSLQGIGITPPAQDLRYVGSYTLNILMSLHIIWLAVSGLQGDLVESRRRVRYWFILFLSVTGSANLFMELAGYSGAVEAIFIHATMLPMLAWAVIWLSKLTPEKLFLKSENDRFKIGARIPDRMRPAFEKLIHVMTVDQIYTDETMTIGKLAGHIGLPEHQLRRLINQGLGYNNFATYLNQYRIAHAKAALSDPEQARIPILTIAMDAGYKTLSTFNRAFKSTENETPSNYRKRALRAALAQSQGA